MPSIIITAAQWGAGVFALASLAYTLTERYERAQITALWTIALLLFLSIYA